jgi:hypothetical protein
MSSIKYFKNGIQVEIRWRHKCTIMETHHSWVLPDLTNRRQTIYPGKRPWKQLLYFPWWILKMTWTNSYHVLRRPQVSGTLLYRWEIGSLTENLTIYSRPGELSPQCPGTSVQRISTISWAAMSFSCCCQSRLIKSNMQTNWEYQITNVFWIASWKSNSRSK